MAASKTVDWQLQKRSWDERIPHILQKQLFTDCMFRVSYDNETKVFEAHKVILAMSSPVFEAMFFGSLPEEKEIVVRDISPATFESMIKWIYTSKIEITSVDEACWLIYAAQKYNLIPLVSECKEWIQKVIKPSTTLRVYEFGDFIDDSSLKKIALDVFKSNTQQVFADPSFDSIKRGTLSTLLDLDSLDVRNETEIFTAVVKWAEQECVRRNLEPNGENQRKVVGNDIVIKIRFLSMTPQDFASSVGDSDFLTTEEKLMLYNSLLCPQKFSANKKLSNITKPRKCQHKIVDWSSCYGPGSRSELEHYMSCIPSVEFCSVKSLMLHGIMIFMSNSSSPAGFSLGRVSQPLRESEITLSLSCLSTGHIALNQSKINVKVEPTTKLFLPKPILLAANTKYRFCIQGQCLEYKYILQNPQFNIFSHNTPGFDPFTVYFQQTTCISGFIYTDVISKVDQILKASPYGRKLLNKN